MADTQNMQDLRLYLIRELLAERPKLAHEPIPTSELEQRRLLRGLMNVRMPGLPSAAFLEAQDTYLKARIAENGITRLDEIEPMRPHVFLWRGDITTLECDAIVNAANENMTGCWGPNHICIDNCIHTFAGVQLRYECAQMMEKQGHLEPTGQAKITAAYNLPAKHVIHTVGPIADGAPTPEHCKLLASSYRSCYELAREQGLRSIAYCCISTGVFGFPQEEAARIAVNTVAELQANDSEPLDVIFNVFSAKDESIYQALLS